MGTYAQLLTGARYTFTDQTTLAEFLVGLEADHRVSNVVVNGLTITLDYDSEA